MPKLVLYSILFFFMAWPIQLWADDHLIEWLPKGKALRQRINLDKRNLEQEIASDQWKVIQPVQLSDSDHEVLIAHNYNADYFFPTPQLIRFAFQGTGIVCDFDVKLATLKRIDRTLHSGYNFGAIRFYRNHVLYSIGGEGFWSYNKQITYFDEKTTREWELYRPKNQGPERISDGFQGYSAGQDVFYSGGGNNKNFLEDEKITFERDFYKFSFKTKTWELVGKISDEISLEEHRTIFWNGTHFVQMARDRIYIIDPQKNALYVYKDNATYFEASGRHYIQGDTVKFSHFNNRGPLSIIPVYALLKQAKYLGTFYEVDYTTYYIWGLGLILLVSLSVWIYRKKQRWEPNFDNLERNLLKALIQAGEQEISTHELNEILDCGSKSQENQRRIRFTTIKQVNEKLAYYYKIKNAIERTPSQEDKRLVNYRLKKGIAEKIKSLL